jgi:NAD(P)-dependent dehydrogenase (short-subunit alcohol dehydrogenase family)
MSSAIDRVVITGASSGIGLDAARRFLRAGSRVIINGSNPDKLERAARSLEGGERVLAVPGDVAAPETAARIAGVARERWGGVDVLVNSAGIFAAKPFLETTPDELDRFLGVNLKGTFQVTQALVPLMISAGGGAIINVGTVLAGQGRVDLPVSAAMASKGGVHALSVSLAAELARHQIRVNTLAPGFIRTPLIGDGADAMAAWPPLGRIGEVSDTSDAVFYLATASYLTGTVLNVDGGYSSGR